LEDIVERLAHQIRERADERICPRVQRFGRWGVVTRGTKRGGQRATTSNENRHRRVDDLVAPDRYRTKLIRRAIEGKSVFFTEAWNEFDGHRTARLSVSAFIWVTAWYWSFSI
jgi:hypothetical protein